MKFKFIFAPFLFANQTNTILIRMLHQNNRNESILVHRNEHNGIFKPDYLHIYRIYQLETSYSNSIPRELQFYVSHARKLLTLCLALKFKVKKTDILKSNISRISWWIFFILVSFFSSHWTLSSHTKYVSANNILSNWRQNLQISANHANLIWTFYWFLEIFELKFATFCSQ